MSNSVNGDTGTTLTTHSLTSLHGMRLLNVILSIFQLTFFFRIVQVHGKVTCFYTTVMRPVLEYACPAWHSSLTAAQAKSLESIQRRAMRVVFQDDDYVIGRLL